MKVFLALLGLVWICACTKMPEPVDSRMGDNSGGPPPPPPSSGRAGFVPVRGFDGTVSGLAAAPGPLGKIYVSGAFTKLGTANVPGLVRLASDGSIDPLFNAGTGGNSLVRVIVPLPDESGIYVAGDFTIFNGTSALRIARLRIDGSLDTGFAIGTGFNGQVLGLSLAGDGSGKLYAAGTFTTYNGVATNRIARLNSDGTLDTTFASGTAFDGAVSTVWSDSSGGVYAGGNFTIYNTASIVRLAHINANGSLDLSFVTSGGANNTVLVILPVADNSGDIFIGGAFTTYAGVGRGSLVRVRPNGSLNTTFSLSAGLGAQVTSLLPLSGGGVIAGGNFTTFNGVSGRNNIIRLNGNGTLNSTFETGGGPNAAVNSMVMSGNQIYVGGSFIAYRNVGVHSLMRITDRGAIDGGYLTGAGFNGAVSAMILAPDDGNEAYIAGAFTFYNGLSAKSIIRVSSAGVVNSSFNIGTGFTGSVSALAPVGAGTSDIYVAGNMTQYNGVGINRIARLKSDGSIDSTFSTGSGFNASVIALATASNAGDVYVGGTFSAYDSVAVGRIVRLTAAGQIDGSFSAGTGFDGSVSGIVMAPDNSGDVYVVGAFTSYNGMAAPRIVRLNANGSMDTGFNPGTGFNQQVLCITTAGGGSTDLYVGGAFNAYNGALNNRIARIHADGTPDADFVGGSGLNSQVNVMAPSGDGSVYVGGPFTTYKGLGATRLVRLRSDGAADAGLLLGTGLNNTPLAILVFNSGAFFVGGTFTNFSGTLVDNLAPLSSLGSLPIQ